jgi:hypothetical protein
MKILRDPDDITNRDAVIFSLFMTALITLAVIGGVTLLMEFAHAQEEPNIAYEQYITSSSEPVNEPIVEYSDIEKENIRKYEEVTKSRELHMNLGQALKATCDPDGSCEYQWEYPEYIFQDGKVKKRTSVEAGLYVVDEEKTKIMLEGIANENFEGLTVVDDHLEYDDMWKAFPTIMTGLSKLNIYHFIGITLVAVAIIGIIMVYDRKEKKLIKGELT